MELTPTLINITPTEAFYVSQPDVSVLTCCVGSLPQDVTVPHGLTPGLTVAISSHGIPMISDDSAIAKGWLCITPDAWE
jgi:hypothetical protein